MMKLNDASLNLIKNVCSHIIKLCDNNIGIIKIDDKEFDLSTDSAIIRDIELLVEIRKLYDK